MMNLKTTFSGSFLLLGLFLSSSIDLFADGCFFYDIENLGNSAESPNQRALIIHDGEMETLVLQVKYSGTVENFAWIIPLPSLPEGNLITTANDSIFKKLHDWTQPKVYRTSGQGYWDGETRGNDFEVSPANPEVQIWEKLQVGPYEVYLLSGSSSIALVDWLAANGYNFPEKANSIIDFYIQKNWYFAAIRVHVNPTLSKENSTYQAGLPGIKITFRTAKPIFPLRISELTSARENEIELYVAASHRMVSESYQTAAMDRNEVQRLIEKQIDDSRSTTTGISCACKRITEPSLNEQEYDYEKIFSDKIASFNQPTFIVEHATMQYTSSDPRSGSFDGYFNDYFAPGKEFWLTRLRTIFPPSSMYDDVYFIPDPHGDEWLTLDIYIEDPSASHPWLLGILGLPGILLLPFLASKRIRKRYARKSIMIILLLLIAIT
jgi:hypothetical protein